MSSGAGFGYLLFPAFLIRSLPTTQWNHLLDSFTAMICLGFLIIAFSLNRPIFLPSLVRGRCRSYVIMFTSCLPCLQNQQKACGVISGIRFVCLQSGGSGGFDFFLPLISLPLYSMTRHIICVFAFVCIAHLFFSVTSSTNSLYYLATTPLAFFSRSAPLATIM